MLPTKQKPRPLSQYAIGVLERLYTTGKAPRQDFNCGAVERLDREGLIVTTTAPSPYDTRKGDLVQWIDLSEHGKYFMGETNHGDE